MKLLKIYPDSINERYVEEAVRALDDGEIIIYPTDSIYAMGCDCLNNRAIEKLCRLKGINPGKNLLSIICSNYSQAAEYAKIDNKAFHLLKTYLPGPFVFILPASTKLPKVFKGRKSVGIRVPENKISRMLADKLGRPLLSSSLPLTEDDPESIANPDSIALNYEKESSISVMIDGGEGKKDGSTIVDCLDSDAPEVVRQGLGVFEE